MKNSQKFWKFWKKSEIVIILTFRPLKGTLFVKRPLKSWFNAFQRLKSHLILAIGNFVRFIG